MAFFLVSAASAGPPQTFFVNTTADTNDGACTPTTCSLRDAIVAANGSAGSTIHFNIGTGDVQTITLDTQLGPLPDITAPVTIEGTSQPNTAGLPFGIAIDGSQLAGLLLNFGSDGSTIGGLALGNFGGAGNTASALEIDSDGNTIAGNSFGVAADGSPAANKNGIFVRGDSNVVGGKTAADRNVIVNNSAGTGGDGNGILIEGNGDNLTATGTAVIGNYLGVLGDGTSKAANDGEDIQVVEAPDTQIGGPHAADGNVIAGGGDDGILLGTFGDSSGSGTTVQHNLIGLGADKVAPLAGGVAGIQVADHGSNTIADNTIANMYQGIDICDSPDNTVVRNLIGSNTANPGGPDFGVFNEGISMENGFCQEVGSATGNTIGGSPGNGNVVTHSQLHGIAVDGDDNEVSYNTVRATKGGPNVQVDATHNMIESNTITGAATGDVETGNGIQVDGGNQNNLGRNSIHGNEALGIALASGANDDQPAPTLDTATFSGGDLQFTGHYDFPTGTGYEIDIYQSPGTCASGTVQGTHFAGAFVADSAGDGTQSFNHTAVNDPYPGGAITATATAPNGSTSEFSSCIDASGTSPSVFIVNTSADSTNPNGCTDDLCSLRDAINAANQAPGSTIDFDIATGSKQIVPDGDLPPITAPTTIDGYSQPGASQNTLALGQGDNAFLPVQLVGGGLEVDPGGEGSVIRGLSFTGFLGRGVDVETDDVTVAGNFIGLPPNGTSDGLTGLDSGVWVAGSNDVVGGPDRADRNVIANAGSSESGIDLTSGSGVLVEGNYIGTDATGNVAAPNDVGIDFRDGATGDTVRGNLISGNQFDGIDVVGEGATGNTIVGNLIGTTADGAGQLGNGESGIDVGADNTTVGGTGAGDGNVVSGNGGDGVLVESPTFTTPISGTKIAGNLIGLDATGATTVGQSRFGIELEDTESTTIEDNVVSGSSIAGILVGGEGGSASTTTVSGNKVGTDSGGTEALGNGDVGGIWVASATDTTIGGSSASDRNMISGNEGDGIDASSGEGLTVEGNWIGVDGSGSAALGNGGAGIDLNGNFPDNTIANNVVSGNGFPPSGCECNTAGDGIDVVTDGTEPTTLTGNRVGTSADGTAAIGNAGDGILLDSTFGDVTVGGTSPGDGNLASGNGGYGIHVLGGDAAVVEGNLVGTDASGTNAVANGSGGIAVDGSEQNTIGGPQEGAGNVVSGNDGPGVSLLTLPGSDSSDYSFGDQNLVQGNKIGVAANGTDSLPNAGDGILVLDGSNNTIGGTDPADANLIANNGSAGVSVETGQLASATGNSIEGNSIFANGGLGIELGSGANDSQSSPVLSSAVSGDGTSVAVSLTSTQSTQYRVEFFSSHTCDPSGNGEGQSFLGSADVMTDANGIVNFSQDLPTVPLGDVITATATGPDSSTSEFSNCAGVTATGGSASLSGSAVASIVKPVNLTAAGSADWALWGVGSSSGDQPPSALTPNDVKAGGGRQISNLSIVGGNGATRGFGSFTGGLVPFNFNWSDGTPDGTGNGVYAGLTAPALGQGLSFTVPADTSSRTLTIWTSAHFADGTLTAHLSDSSAPDYTQVVHAVAGQFTTSGENVPAIFTIQYNAASAGQHLTITWNQTANNSCGGCEDIVLYGVALSGSGTASTVSASLTGDTSVGMAGSDVPIADIPLFAFEAPPLGSPPLQLNGLQLNGLQLNGLQLNGLQLNGLQLNGLQLNGLQLNGLQLNGLQLNGLPADLQLNGLQLNGLQLNGLPLNPSQFPGGWPQVLAGTPLANQPLQTITLQQVLALPNPPVLTLGSLDFSGSPLGQATVGALALGATQLNGLPPTFQNTIETELDSWCLSVVPSGDPNHICGVGGHLGEATLLQLGLAGAPIQGLQLNGLQLNGLQLNGLQLNGLQLNGLAGSASSISGLQLNGLQLNGLPAGQGIGGLQLNGLPTSVLNLVCISTSTFNCSRATLAQAQQAGALNPNATVGLLDTFFGNLTIGQLLQSLLGPNSIYAGTATFGDLVGLLIHRADVPWESLSPGTLSLFDKSRPTMGLSAGFTIQSGTSADVQVTIPDGFDFDPGSATLARNGTPVAAPGNPTITGQTLDWPLTSIDAGVPYTLAFKVRSGTTVGPAHATETVTAGGQSNSSIAAFSVTDSYPGNGTAPAAAAITPDEGVQMSALATPGAVDYYKIPMPPAGTRIHVHLTDLPADYDLALYSNTTTTVRTGNPFSNQPPLQDGVVPDRGIDLDGGSNGPLTPTGLQDIPNPGIPLVQVSDNRGTDDEDVGIVSPGGGGFVTVAVFGYNGAFSPHPYTLRMTTQAPTPTQTCSARTFPFSGKGTTPDSLPSLTSLPANLNTVILVNEARLGNTYALNPEKAALAKLRHLATGDAALGVSGVLVPVEKISGVANLYKTWDSNPCDPNAANAVANAIANYLDLIKQARPGVKYVVFGGGDDQIPFFRTPDLSLIANEEGFASQFGANEYRGALAAGDLLTDNPYLDTSPIPAAGRQLFIPDLVGGRLVETADDIANAVTSFESSRGTLRSGTGFVSGYDFVSDSSALIARELGAIPGFTGVRQLPNPIDPTGIATWTGTDLLNATFSGGQAAITDWNGHFDNTRTQAADGTSLVSTSQLVGANAFSGGVFFTMGCHAGFQTTDAVIGSSVLDWPQYFAQHNTGFVGNTGYGIGSTDSIGFAEELMADFAANLNGSLSLGDALTQAKDQYYLSRVAFSSYDEKTLSEAELYGLPMYGIGQAPHSLLAAALVSNPDPVPGTSQSTSPSQGSTSNFSSGVQSAGFAATPTFELHRGKNGDFYSNGGQVQAPNYRPLQPYVSLPATRNGLFAHGVVIDSLTSEDHTTDGNGHPWAPDNVRPILDLSKHEPAPAFTDETWPEKIPTLVSLVPNQSLNLITGQFFTDSSGGSPTERLWTQINGRVTYSSSQDFTPPTIDSTDAYLAGGTVHFSGHFRDLDQNGNPGSVVFAQVVFDDGSGNWSNVPLTLTSSAGAFNGAGTAPFGGQHLQYFVMACDAAGNCGYSSNKGRYFDATPATAPTITSPNITTFVSGGANSFTVQASGTPTPALSNGFNGCTSTLPGSIAFADNGDGTATLTSSGTLTPGTYTLCLRASNAAAPDAVQSVSVVVRAPVTPTFAGITFANTIPSGNGKVPDCSTTNPFKTGTNDVNTFPNAICSTDGNAPAPSTFSWAVELGNGTPQNATPVVNTGAPIPVTVKAILTHGTRNGQKPSLVGDLGATVTIPTGSAASSARFQVQNIGNGDWIQVTVQVDLGGGRKYTLMLQVH